MIKEKAEKMNQTTKGILITLGFFIIVLLTGIFLATGKQSTDEQLPKDVVGATITSAQGAVINDSSQNTPQYKQMLKQDDIYRAKDAEASGHSSFSNYIDNTSNSNPLPEKTEMTKAKEVVPPPPPQPMPVLNQPVINPQILKATEQQMQESLIKWKAREPSMLGTAIAFPRQEKQPESSSNQVVQGTLPQNNQNNQRQQGQQAKPDVSKAIVRAGDLFPAILDVSGSTDRPSVMRATIQGGKINGAILLGTIQKLGEDGAGITFNRLILPEKTVSVNAIAMNATADSTNVANRVDRKYLERFVFKPLSAAANALAAAIPMKRQTVSVASTTGMVNSSSGITNRDVSNIAVAKAIQEASQELSNKNTNPVAYVDQSSITNTFISVMFLDDVY